MAEYGALVAYLQSFSGAVITTYPSRQAVTLEAPGPVVGSVFGTEIGRYILGNQILAQPTTPPTLPSSLAPIVREVVGLGTSPSDRSSVPVGMTSVSSPVAAGGPSPGRTPSLRPSSALPPAPVTTAGRQLIFPTDLQVAYDEEGLLAQYGAPSTSDVATILWSGTYTGSSNSTRCGTLVNGSSVGPYDPSDFSAFFNQTSPSGQLHPSLRSVNVSGPTPGCLASWDTSGTVVANTAELEAIGALAPGATVWAVGVSSPTLANLDAALMEILSPPSNLSPSEQAGLRAVQVVDVGWVLPDMNDSSWWTETALAQSKGITLVAPTGNAADAPASSSWTGANASFPSSVGTGFGGSLAVGGSTLQLNAVDLHITSETAWYVPSSGRPASTVGSSGGISKVYPEPSWQSSSLARTTLGGLGRGVPDIAAIANNTLVTVTVAGAQKNATNASTGTGYVAVNGTGVAAAVVAGLLTTIDHVVTARGAAPLGYLDPTLYRIASEEYFGLPNGTAGTGSVGHVQGSSPYLSGLPTLPLRDIVSGRSAAFTTGVGYDLVTGWGSLDAYNYTMYLLPAPSAPVWGRLQGVEDTVNLTSLAVTSHFPGGLPPTVSASIQENMFLANSLGAPVYWVQSVTTLNYSGSGKWTTDYQGWVIQPFWGIYPSLVVYEFAVPPAVTATLPLSLTLETLLLPGSVSSPATLEFAFGATGSAPLLFSVPGASYIIGSENYTYDWQGVNYTNGPNGSAPGGAAGFLAPQLALVGFPGGATATFQPGTSGNLVAFVEPLTGATFERAGTGLVSPSSTQTGEVADNLTFTATGPNTYSFAYAAGSGTAEQGIYQFEVPRFTVRFNETGAPVRTTWYVNITGPLAVRGSAPSTSSSLVFSLPNGSYTWYAAIGVHAWASVPPNGPLAVAGRAISVNLTFGPAAAKVVFYVLGPPASAPLPFTWSVRVAGGPNLTGSTVHLNTTLGYGSYTYTASDTNTSWKPAQPSGSFVINQPSQVIYVRMNLVTYVCELVFSLPGGIAPHMQVQIGSHVAIGYFSTFAARVPNGSVNWTVSNLDSGDSASPAKGRFVVHGAGPASDHGKYVVLVTITAPPNKGFLGLGPWEGYALVGSIGAAAVLAVVVLLRRRRHRRTEWDEDAAPEPAPSEPSFDESE